MSEPAILQQAPVERPLELQRNRALKLVSRPGESPEDFAKRCDAAAQERADAEAAKIRDRLEAKRDRLDKALAQAQRRVEELDTDTRTRQASELISGAGAVLGALFGGRRSARSMASAIGGAASRRGVTARTSQRRESAEEKVEATKDDLARRVLMHGGPGFGAWDGDKPARVKLQEKPDQRMLGFHSPVDKRYAPHAALIVERFKLRGLGSSTLHLAYVGAGLLDATVDHNVKVWDIAAAVPFCQGAGGEVRYLKGPLFPLAVFDLKMARIPFVAGAPEVCDELERLLR